VYHGERNVRNEITKYVCLPRHQNAGRNLIIKMVNISFEMWQSSDVWDKSSELHSRINLWHIKFRECLVLLSSECFVFSCRIKNPED